MLGKMLTILLVIATSCCALTSAKPEQIHLSLGANPTEMVVTWTTFTKSKLSTVKYNKIGGQVHTVDAVRTHFTDKNYEAYIYRAKLTGLEPGLSYEYQCGSDNGWSEIYKFKAISDSKNFSPRFAIYGDLGYENGISTPQLQADVKNDLYDAILHIGDIAYNLNKDDGKIGDLFMRQIEPIAASVPYQVCPGNHEDKRGLVNNHYYSFDMGSVHFVSFSTELYFWPEYFTESHRKWQYEWLENDLRTASKPENRIKRPWIITLGHRPMYCISEDEKDCFKHESIIRKGKFGDDLTVQTQYGLEDLFQKYGVDIQFYGHQHLYERSFPVYDNQVYNSSNAYTNAKAPIQIVTGAAGTTDRPEKKVSLPHWTAFYAQDYGFTRMNVHNETHITIQQISVEKETKIIDSIVVKKDHYR